MTRGGSRGAKKVTLRDYTRGKPSAEDEARFRKAMNAPSDMVTAIIQAVELDYLIEWLIVSRLTHQDDETIDMLSKENGPLGTFFGKIVLGYAMGFYDAGIMEFLHTIRRIRNAFAHSRRDISFATDLVRGEIRGLKPPPDNPDLAKTIDLCKRLTAITVDDPDHPEEVKNLLETTGRAAYVILCMEIGNRLLRAHGNILPNPRDLNMLKRMAKKFQ